jgi:signal transduction histidine kinase
MNPATWSLDRRVSALVSIVAAMLGLVALGTVAAATANRADTHQVVEILTPALINNERLYLGLVRQQSSMRTFMLTARESDLTGYTEATQAEAGLLAGSRRLLADQPELRKRFDRIAEALAGYRDAIAEPLIVRVRATGPDPTLATPDERSRTRYRLASDQLTAFGATLSQRRATASHRARDSNTMLIGLLVAATGTVVVAGTALTLLLRRTVTAPVARLAAEVRSVAAGDYQHRISGMGVPDLVDLARDVDGMRRQIATELAEVDRVRRQLEVAYQRLEQQTEELTRSNRDLEQFAYVASHDLQEPLRKVASFCQLLQRRYAGQLDERADQYIAFAVDGAHRMQRLINDLLAFSRIGRLNTGFGPVDLDRVTADATNQLEAERDRTGAEVTWADLPVVWGEEPLLLALISNLIVNSIKFHRPDEPPRVHLSGRRSDDQWEVSCRDNGIGISAEFSEKVFVIFQRLHPKLAYPGTGIGLAISKKIVEYHGGQIWVDQEYRDGALIRFTLPARQGATIDGPAPDEGAGVADVAASVSTTRPDGDGTTRPDGDGTTRPDGDGTTRPDGDGTTRPDGDGTTRPDGDGTTRPDGHDAPGPSDPDAPSTPAAALKETTG